VLLAWAPSFYYDRFSLEVTDTVDVIWALSFLAFPVVGLILTLRMPSNAVGWLFLMGPALAGAGISVQEYSEVVGRPDLLEVADGVLFLGILLLLSSILVFPDGRYPNRWFRWAHVIGIGGILIVPILNFTGLVVAYNFVLTVVALIYRLVRGDAITRRQIAGPVFVAFFGSLLLVATGLLVPPNNPELGDLASVVAFVILSVGIPVAILVAITRYRLYEIDRIVSRTVSYTLVVISLGAAYVGGVTWLTFLLPDQSQLVVAATTLAVAALFSPVRRRIQNWVDRRFNRSRYDIQRVMDGFADSLRDQVDTEQVVQGWVGVVSQTMQPASIAVWTRGLSRNDSGTVAG
jgi:hypothetical protein